MARQYNQICSPACASVAKRNTHLVGWSYLVCVQGWEQSSTKQTHLEPFKYLVLSVRSAVGGCTAYTNWTGTELQNKTRSTWLLQYVTQEARRNFRSFPVAVQLYKHIRMDLNGKTCPINNDSSSWLSTLLKRSIAAKEKSYSPYSKFRVGSALLTEKDEIFDGCNVENASYGLSICAERTAIVKAISCGHRKIKAIAISTDVEEFLAPCGACRQYIAEFGVDCDVYLVKSDLSYKSMTLRELLPMAFTVDDLQKQRLNKDAWCVKTDCIHEYTSVMVKKR